MTRTIVRGDDFDDKLAALQRGSFDRLHVLCDFDSTLTTPTSSHSWSAVERYKGFSALYLERVRAVRRHFLELENAPLADVPRARKVGAMRDWWRIAQQLIVDERPTRATLRLIVERLADFELRSGVERFLRTLHERNVPLTLLSAGIGDVIVLLLRSRGLLLPNIRICRFALCVVSLARFWSAQPTNERQQFCCLCL